MIVQQALQKLQGRTIIGVPFQNNILTFQTLSGDIDIPLDDIEISPIDFTLPNFNVYDSIIGLVFARIAQIFSVGFLGQSVIYSGLKFLYNNCTGFFSHGSGSDDEGIGRIDHNVDSQDSNNTVGFVTDYLCKFIDPERTIRNVVTRIDNKTESQTFIYQKGLLDTVTDKMADVWEGSKLLLTGGTIPVEPETKEFIDNLPNKDKMFMLLNAIIGKGFNDIASAISNGANININDDLTQYIKEIAENTGFTDTGGTKTGIVKVLINLLNSQNLY